MASGNWFYATQGQQQGPVTLDALQSLVQSGELRSNDPVWTEGMANWAAAGTIAALFPSSTTVVETPNSIDQAPANVNPAATAIGVIGYYTPTYQFVYAGFWLRFCAIFIDGITLAIPIAGTGFAVRYMIRQNAAPQRPEFAILFVLGLDFIMLMGSWLYFALMESSSWQATLGKRAVGIIVIDETGARISFARATGRFFGKILSYMIFYIGFIMAGFTAKKQALHDLLASTLVIRKTP